MALKITSNTPQSKTWQNPEKPHQTAKATLSLQPVKRGQRGMEFTYFVVKRRYEFRDVALVASPCGNCKVENPVVVVREYSTPPLYDLAEAERVLAKMESELGARATGALLAVDEL